MSRALATALLALSCSHARPAPLTASEHRAEAARHEQTARQEAARYDPEQTERYPGRSPWRQSPSDWTTTYNPTEAHLAAADREMREAAEHLAAAHRLELFESAACESIPPVERAACPLLASSVLVVRNTKSGVELTLKNGVDGAETHRRLDCHLAYAEANGFQRPSCPLFVPGMSISLKDARVLVLRGDTPQVARQLQEQARRIFAPEVVSVSLRAAAGSARPHPR
jgi:hypothetical protein